ncbi:hypothetical protein ACQ4PT_051584 [Festuca glaucescens]
MMNAGSHPARRVMYLPIKIADHQHSAANTTDSGNNNACYILARSFSVQDYEWQIDYHPNGFHPKGYHDQQCWVKLRLTLIRGPSSDATASFVGAAPLTPTSFTFRFVDPSRTPVDPLPEVTERSTFPQIVPTEVPLAPRAALKAGGYLGRDGNCFVRCQVTLFHEPDTAATHPSRDLGQDLGNLLTSQNATDVTFVVGSSTGAESFGAHRCACSPRGLLSSRQSSLGA